MATRTNESLKARLLELRSPIRWAILGLLVAIWFFCFEVFLSGYSLYLSLAGGSVTIIPEWLHSASAVFFFAVSIVSGVGLFVVLGLIVWAVVVWRGNIDTGADQRLDNLKRDHAEIHKAIMDLTQELRNDRRSNGSM